MRENLRVLGFAVIVCLGCSILVSAAALGLRERQQANLLLDIRKNILKSVDLLGEGLTESEVNEIYDARIVGKVISKSGQVVEGKTPAQIDPDTDTDQLALFECVDDGEIVAYTFPIVGRGLWSTLYGYFALEADLNTVRGITFYQHGETPGLGGEISEPWFQKNFVGKKILGTDGSLVSVRVVKGHAADKHPNDLEHYVDGISGATITSRGVTEMLQNTLAEYEPYFDKIRGNAT